MKSSADEVTYRDATDVITVHLIDRLVVHVGLATSWRTTGQPTLGWRFNQVFRDAANDPMYRTADGVGGPPPLDSTGFDNISPRDLWQRNYFDHARFNQVADRMLELNEKLADQGPASAPQFDFTPAVGISSNHKVTVKLGPSKAVQSIEFDEDWALEVKTERITATVLDALERSYETYVAPVRIEDGSAALGDELASLRRDTLSLLGLQFGKESA